MVSKRKICDVFVKDGKNYRTVKKSIMDCCKFNKNSIYKYKWEYAYSV